MNKKQVVASLNKIANELDNNGLYQEANVVTNVMVKISQSYVPPPNSLGAFVNDPVYIKEVMKSIEDQAKKDIKQKINEKDIEGAKQIYRETLKKLKDPSNFIREVSPTINDPSVPIASLEPMPAPMAPVPDSPSTNTAPVGRPNPLGPGKPSQPSSKPGMPSKPGGSKPSAPKSADGLDRWVNKAENIYSAWALKNANPNSSAFGLIADIVDYMQRVKSKLPSNLQGSADAKINKVKQMKDSIPTGTPLTAYLLTTDYSEVSGVKGKGANPFTYDPSKRLTGKQLDYQADYESKRY